MVDGDTLLPHKPVSYTHLDVYKRQLMYETRAAITEHMIFRKNIAKELDSDIVPTMDRFDQFDIDKKAIGSMLSLIHIYLDFKHLNLRSWSRDHNHKKYKILLSSLSEHEKRLRQIAEEIHDVPYTTGDRLFFETYLKRKIQLKTLFAFVSNRHPFAVENGNEKSLKSRDLDSKLEDLSLIHIFKPASRLPAMLNPEQVMEHSFLRKANFQRNLKKSVDTSPGL